MILWDFHNCEHLSAHLPLVGELRAGASFFYFETGDRTAEAAKAFAVQIADIMHSYSPGNKRLAVDKMENLGYAALIGLGLEILEGQALTEHARSIKNENELINSADLIIQLGLLSEEKSSLMKEGQLLVGVLDPYSSNANVLMLKRAGFKDITSVFKFLCFEGFLAVK